MYEHLADYITADLITPAIAIAMLLVVTHFVYAKWWRSKRAYELTCPGLKPTHPESEKLKEITNDGGLHQFPVENHRKLGPIFTFFTGKTLVLSVASPKLFKDVQMLCERPNEPFEAFKPLIGWETTQAMNSHTVGPVHRKLHDRHYGYMATRYYFRQLYDISQELVAKWKASDVGSHIVLTQEMLSKWNWWKDKISNILWTFDTV